MRRDDLDKLDLPDAPGVYRFVRRSGGREETLYVGKATSLRDRVRSYFADDLIASRGPRLVDIVTRAQTVRVEQTDTVLDALVLEALLIKKYQPPGNVRAKDDTSFLYAVVTAEEWPRVLPLRGRDIGVKLPLRAVARQYGPFTSGPTLREALRIIKRIFPFYDTPRPVTADSKHQRARIEFNRQIGRYPRGVSREEYLRTIRHVELFLSGRKKALLAELTRDMTRFAKAERFEDADRVKRQLYALTHLSDVSLIKDDLKEEDRARRGSTRIEAYDVAHTGGKGTIGAMVVVEDGTPEKQEYRIFSIRSAGNDDLASLTELLERRFAHPEWPFPRGIVIDGGPTHKKTAEAVLARMGVGIPVAAVVKDERHRPSRLLGMKGFPAAEADALLANAEAHRFVLARHRRGRRIPRS